jgi:hypothetical protein
MLIVHAEQKARPRVQLHTAPVTAIHQDWQYVQASAMHKACQAATDQDVSHGDREACQAICNPEASVYDVSWDALHHFYSCSRVAMALHISGVL